MAALPSTAPSGAVVALAQRQQVLPCNRQRLSRSGRPAPESAVGSSGWGSQHEGAAGCWRQQLPAVLRHVSRVPENFVSCSIKGATTAFPVRTTAKGMQGKLPAHVCREHVTSCRCVALTKGVL